MLVYCISHTCMCKYDSYVHIKLNIQCLTLYLLNDFRYIRIK